MTIWSLAVVLRLQLFNLSRKIFYVQYKVSYLGVPISVGLETNS